MAKFFVNGKEATSQGKSLMDFLREDLRLTSVKNGCKEGACGSCTVIVDGKAKKACVLKTDKLEGCAITTLEGLSKREKEVFAYAFAKVGAVQCGFCIPGMILCAKTLIDKNNSLSKEDVKQGIKNNICRCTGYKKIEEGILLAAKIIRENLPVQKEEGVRVDAYEKALGQAEYTDDMVFEDMVYGGAVRSLYPRGRVISIDLTLAKQHKDFVCAVTAKDVPGTKNIGHLKKDWPVLVDVGQTTHYLGDAIVLVGAKTKEGLEEIKRMVKIEQEELTPITSPKEALKADAPLLHQEGNVLATEHLVRGDADLAIKNSKYVVTQNYSTPFTEHAFLEPECAIALKTKEGVHLYTADQGIYQTQKECAQMLNIPEENVRVSAKTVGGGFGGKEDMSVQHHTALLCFISGRTVKFLLSRKESILVHPKRHPMEIECTLACDEQGNLTAMKAKIVSDTGAYASLGGPVLQRACTHAAGPYHYQTIAIEGKAVYTNNPPAGAFRGFGVSQSCFALECNLNRLAEMAGISYFDIRYKNAIRPGEVLPNGQIADSSTAMAETLEAVKEEYTKAQYAGIACAMKNSGLGVGIPDVGRCKLVVKEGKVYIHTSAACIGQGLKTVLVHMVCKQTKLKEKEVIHMDADTATAPNSGNTTASRQTLFTGEAARKAAELLEKDLQTATLEELNNKEYYGEYAGITDKMGSPKENPVSHIAYGYATQVVILNGDGIITKVIAAHDVGRVIHKTSLEGQIEGGVVMSLGYALTEKYPLENCVPTAKFGTLGLFKSVDTPYVEPICIGKEEEGAAFGAKGVGEICSIPTAPAVTLAYERLDGKIRTSLPISDTPYK